MVLLKEGLELGKLVHQLTSQHLASASCVLALNLVCRARFCGKILRHFTLERPDRWKDGNEYKAKCALASDFSRSSERRDSCCLHK